MGLNALRADDVVSTRVCLEESLALMRVADDHELRGEVLATVGRLRLAEGDLAAARALFLESLAIRRLRCARLGLVECLEGLAAVEGMIGCRERAARLFGAAAALRQSLGTPLPPADRPEHDCCVAALRAELGVAAFAAAWGAGERMMLETALGEAVGDDASRSQEPASPL
jgi:hypothetical protein